jgi:hypothetical protein
MSIPVLVSEVEAAIELIQENIDSICSCFRPDIPRSLTLAAFLHHRNDNRRIFKNGL